MPPIDPLLISIVVPVFNEEKVLREFHKRTAQALSVHRFEILFVNDGSTDGSWEIIQDLTKADARVAGLSLSRNFGHQAALTAGLEHAQGDAVVLMDADLQDPPEVIPGMIQKWQAGYDVVYGIRSKRKGESLFKKFTASVFYRIFRGATSVPVSLEAGDFRLLSRKVVDVLNQTPERIRFLRALTSWVGFNQTAVPYVRDPRFAGKSKYPLFKMLKFAFDGLTSFSSLPLQLASYLGFAVTTVAFLVALYSLYVRLFTQTAVRGWTSLLIVVIFLGGVQLLMIGIIGEYIGRIYEEVKRRPLYLLKEKVGARQERPVRQLWESDASQGTS